MLYQSHHSNKIDKAEYITIRKTLILKVLLIASKYPHIAVDIKEIGTKTWSAKEKSPKYVWPFIYEPTAVISPKTNNGNKRYMISEKPLFLISIIEKRIKIKDKAKVNEPYKTKLEPKEKAINANTSIAKKLVAIIYFGNPSIFSFKAMRIL